MLQKLIKTGSQFKIPLFKLLGIEFVSNLLCKLLIFEEFGVCNQFPRANAIQLVKNIGRGITRFDIDYEEIPG